MILYLVRHGKAVSSHPDGDRHRPLSAEGKLRIEGMIPQAFSREFRADLTLSSPYLRAVQTRTLFAPVLGEGQAETSKALTPDADPADAFDELTAWEAMGFGRIAVFTHNPFVTDLAGRLLIPGSLPDLTFHTPTILALDFPGGLVLGTGRPLWILHP